MSEQKRQSLRKLTRKRPEIDSFCESAFSDSLDESLENFTNKKKSKIKIYHAKRWKEYYENETEHQRILRLEKKNENYKNKIKDLRPKTLNKIKLNENSLNELNNLLLGENSIENTVFPKEDLCFDMQQKYFKKTQNKLDINLLKNIKCCAVCSLLFPCYKNNSITIQIYKINELKHLNLLKSTKDNEKIFLNEFVYNTQPKDILNGLILNSKGIYTDTNQETLMNICSECFKCINNNILPKLSIANGFFLGTLLEDLPLLSFIEEQCISRVRFSSIIIKLTKLHGSQKGFKGHLIARAQNPNNILKLLPIGPKLLTENLQIILVSTRNDVNDINVSIYEKLVIVSKLKIKIWLEYLKKYNPNYVDVEIDYNIIDKYPENGIAEEFKSSFSKVNDFCNDDYKIEKGVNVDSNLYSHPITNIDQCQSSFILDENGSTIPMKDIKEYLDYTLKLNLENKETYDEDAIAIIPGNSILNTSNSNFFANAFPTLFPHGTGHPYMKKQKQISFEDEIQHRLLILDDRFRHNLLFQFLSYNIINQKQFFQSINYRVNNMSSTTQTIIGNLTEEKLEKALKDHANQIENTESKQIYNQLTLIGSKAPFSQISKVNNKRELYSMLINKGSPTLYITISPNDVTHILAYVFCLKDPKTFNFLNNEITDTQFRTRQASKNPVSLSQFFNFLISNILNYLFGQENEDKLGIFGKLKSYYGMVETQTRGTLHIHMLLWIKGAPNADIFYSKLDTNEQFKNNITDYINKIITTDYCPSEIKQYENITDDDKQQCLTKEEEFFQTLYKDYKLALSTYQLHKCGFSCFKNNLNLKCRYRMPEITSETTKWSKETGSFLIRKENGYINNFNLFLNSIVKSNTDVQIISTGNEGLAIIQYICNYITKNSVGVDTLIILQKVALKKTLKDPLPNLSKGVKNMNSTQLKCRDFFIRLLHQINKCSQVAANEISTKLLKLPMSYCSHKFTTLFIYSIQIAYQEYKLLDFDQRNDQKTQELITKNISITKKGNIKYDNINNYIYRNENLKHLNLYDFTQYLKLSQFAHEIDFPFVKQHKFASTKGMSLKKDPDIPTIYGQFFRKPSVDSSLEEIETYKESICLLFQPFTDFKDINYEIFLNNASLKTLELIENLDLLHRSRLEAIRKTTENKTYEQFISDGKFQSDFIDEDYEQITEGIGCSNKNEYLNYINASDILEDYRDYDNSEIETLKIITNNKNPNERSSIDEYYPTFTNKTKFSKRWNKIDLFLDQIILKKQNESESFNLNKDLNYNPFNLLIENINNLNFTSEELMYNTVEKYNLNELQSKAFIIIIQHITNPIKKQLIFYIGGEGGTGKSRIIDAVSYYFAQYNISSKLKKMAFCGTAAYNIGGRTIHSLIKIKKMKKKNENDTLTIEDRSNLERTWNGTLCQIIDEISFCPADLLIKLNNTQKEIFQSTAPFGGLHTILLGDFHQHLAIGIRIYETELWDKINHTIILKLQMRAAGDLDLLKILTNLRSQKSSEEDYKTLNKYLLSEKETDLDSEDWEDAQFIIPSKKLGFHINNICARKFSKKNKTPLIIIVALDTINNERPSNSNIKNAIIEKTTIANSDNNKSEHYRILELCIGSKLMINHNIPHLSEYGLTNGCHGTVYDIIPLEGMEKNIHYFEGENIIIMDRPPIGLFK